MRADDSQDIRAEDLAGAIVLFHIGKRLEVLTSIESRRMPPRDDRFERTTIDDSLQPLQVVIIFAIKEAGFQRHPGNS